MYCLSYCVVVVVCCELFGFGNMLFDVLNGLLCDWVKCWWCWDFYWVFKRNLSRGDRVVLIVMLNFCLISLEVCLNGDWLNILLFYVFVFCDWVMFWGVWSMICLWCECRFWCDWLRRVRLVCCWCWYILGDLLNMFCDGVSFFFFWFFFWVLFNWCFCVGVLWVYAR